MFGFDKDGPVSDRIKKAKTQSSSGHFEAPAPRTDRFKTVRKYLFSVMARVAALADFYECADRSLKKAIEGDNPIASPKQRWSEDDSRDHQALEETRAHVRAQAAALNEAVDRKSILLRQYTERSQGEAAAAANQLATEATTTYERLASRARVDLVPYRESKGNPHEKKFRSFLQKAALVTSLCQAFSGGMLKGLEASQTLQEIFQRSTANVTALYEAAPPSYQLQYRGYGNATFQRSESPAELAKVKMEALKAADAALGKMVSTLKAQSERTSAKVKGVVGVKMSSTLPGDKIRLDFGVFEKANVFNFGGYDVAYT